MKLQLNETYLITTNEWFLSPDGEMYKAVFGTVTGIEEDEHILGIKTNRNSSNWYITIGNMILAGCQVHYAIKTESYSSRAPVRAIEHEGCLLAKRTFHSNIYNADEEYQQ